MNESAKIALQQYQEKVASGEIEKSIPKNPKEKWLDNKTSLRFSINAMCFECMGGCKGDSAVNEIRHCSSYECPLYEVRPYQSKSEKTNV